MKKHVAKKSIQKSGILSVYCVLKQTLLIRTFLCFFFLLWSKALLTSITFHYNNWPFFYCNKLKVSMWNFELWNGRSLQSVHCAKRKSAAVGIHGTYTKWQLRNRGTRDLVHLICLKHLFRLRAVIIWWFLPEEKLLSSCARNMS